MTDKHIHVWMNKQVKINGYVHGMHLILCASDHTLILCIRCYEWNYIRCDWFVTKKKKANSLTKCFSESKQNIVI